MFDSTTHVSAWRPKKWAVNSGLDTWNQTVNHLQEGYNFASCHHPQYPTSLDIDEKQAHQEDFKPLCAMACDIIKSGPESLWLRIDLFNHKAWRVCLSLISFPCLQILEVFMALYVFTETVEKESVEGLHTRKREIEDVQQWRIVRTATLKGRKGNKGNKGNEAKD